jgi:gamma-glutamyltranspeptidase/glutathione hydrolase/leukotriene-C4 hydrolase
VDNSLLIAIEDKQARFPPLSPIYYTYANKQLGDIIQRPKLAKTLKTLQTDPESFYVGALAEELVKDIASVGGILTTQDFANYAVREMELINTTVFGHQVVSVAGEYGGAVLMQTLNTVAQFSVADYIPQSLHYIIESLKFAYANRLVLGDPTFVKDVNTKIIPTMISPAHAKLLAQRIAPHSTYKVQHYAGKLSAHSNRCLAGTGCSVERVQGLNSMIDFFFFFFFVDLGNITEPSPTHGTTHLSIVDQWGAVVSVTSTINLYFGSLEQSEENGLLFNDEMDDFSSPDRPNNYGYPPSPANYIQPFKRPLSSMTPIIVEKDHQFLLALGGSGGSKIPTGVMNVLLQRILYQQPLAAAVSLPRLPDQLLPIGVNFGTPFHSSQNKHTFF